MDNTELRSIIEAQLDECQTLLKCKGADYVPGGADALGNFKRNAEELGMTPYQVLAIYWNKHVSAIKNFIRRGGVVESEPIEGRITDCINYLLLLRALVEDAKQPKRSV